MFLLLASLPVTLAASGDPLPEQAVRRYKGSRSGFAAGLVMGGLGLAAYSFGVIERADDRNLDDSTQRDDATGELSIPFGQVLLVMSGPTMAVSGLVGATGVRDIDGDGRTGAGVLALLGTFAHVGSHIPRLTNPRDDPLAPQIVGGLAWTAAFGFGVMQNENNRSEWNRLTTTDGRYVVQLHPTADGLALAGRF